VGSFVYPSSSLSLSRQPTFSSFPFIFIFRERTKEEEKKIKTFLSFDFFFLIIILPPPLASSLWNVLKRGRDPTFQKETQIIQPSIFSFSLLVKEELFFFFLCFFFFSSSFRWKGV
jgi:hypothetical protein